MAELSLTAWEKLNERIRKDLLARAEAFESGPMDVPTDYGLIYVAHCLGWGFPPYGQISPQNAIGADDFNEAVEFAKQKLGIKKDD